MRKYFLSIFNFILLSSIFLTGCAEGNNNDEILIGVTGPLTGPTANSGVAMKEGMEVALEEWNSNGGIEINGEKKLIRMIFEDNQGEPSEGVSTAEKLLNNDNVDFLIGDAFASSVTMAIMELASQYEKPILSGQPVSHEISQKILDSPEKYKYFWKGNFDAAAYGETSYMTVKHLIDQGEFTPKNNTLAFIVEDTDYGRSNVEAAIDLFARDGWEQVAFETVEVGHTDFYPQLTKLNSSKPDVLISVFTAVSSGVSLVKQFNEMNIDALHLGIFYPGRPEFLEQAGQSADGLVWLPLIFDPQLIERQREFVEIISEKFKVDATTDHAFGYDTMSIALNSIKNAQNLEPESIVSELSETNLDSLLGTYEFDQESHTVKFGPDYIPVPTSQVQNGKNEIIFPDNIATERYLPQPWINK